MVITRRSAGNGLVHPQDVELAENGKAIQAIPIKHRSKSESITSSKKSQFSEGGVLEPSQNPPKKKETRGRKRKDQLPDPLGAPLTPKVETRGRKRKLPMDGPTPKRVQNDANSPPDESRDNTVRRLVKHDINHLLTDDTPPPLVMQNSAENSSVVVSNGRIPITSIISQKIDGSGEQGLSAEPLASSGSSTLSMSTDTTLSSISSDKKTKRRYRVDRDNIKINKRIMSKDTEDVIAMFKKFDDEVLTNPEARQRLLSLGFETRKRYITTFKHYIRFCCKKQLHDFFVTGELMKEFYEEQFALSSSNNPVIRLRKMDPAFSKLQEINFLVYHLKNKEIPNRNIALEYLVLKELETQEFVNGNSTKLSGDDEDSKRKSPRRVVVRRPPKVKNVSEESLESSQYNEFSDQEEVKLGPEHEKNIQQSQIGEEMSFVTTIDSIPAQSPLIQTVDMTALRNQFNKMRNEINESLQHKISDGELKSEIARSINESLSNFEFLIHPVILTPPPIIEMNHDLHTVHEICQEWFTKEPSIQTRLARWGKGWIRDQIDHSTFLERKAIVEFVERMSRECGGIDVFGIATDVDMYIRDKSILEEFISEIELDVEMLFKKIMTYRQIRG
ncbi:uncharacterized protein SPAPADRAFT_64742 [Spathaspora passalidarum NRRL Y-27907]|uniref:Transcription activator GCR1-like domain-containing protein n=1 Tax=Spathaspora passalidarum (strain NRRL Y-27907 / 11-Y1) TaxID=619300 RepID=G3AEM3_SPAPN|nr:uncharacterized protein SPAPADRAFT_64742 [Spathaspora passalidarum NRRL Y-27907]EGW35649.1 hypothetical protein SPAPADRAFT_64742 [Spathaspora passalidarum NRRL Y-27907]